MTQMFAAVQIEERPTDGKLRRAERAVKEIDPDLNVTGAGYPVVTHCKYQVWIEAPAHYADFVYLDNIRRAQSVMADIFSERRIKP